MKVTTVNSDDLKKSPPKSFPTLKALLEGTWQGPLPEPDPTFSRLLDVHNKWSQVFMGTLRALGEKNWNFARGIFKELVRVGLIVDGQTLPPLFDVDVTDDTLRKAQDFNKTVRIPDLRGKTRSKLDPLIVLYTYISICEVLKDLPPRKGWASPKNLGRGSGRNIKDRYWNLKNLLSGKMPKLSNALKLTCPPDGLLNRWSHLLPKQIALKVTAYQFRSRGRPNGVSTATINKLLSRKSLAGLEGELPGVTSLRKKALRRR